MKKLLAIVALCASVCLLGGCDFFRILAGRPTSRDIEAKRARIEREAERKQREEDSLRLAWEQEQLRLKRQADSLARLDSLCAAQEKIVPSKRVAAGGRVGLEYRYYVVIGAFSVPQFAARQAARAEAAGYPAVQIPFRNGNTAIGVCPSNSLAEIHASLKRLRGESFCPAEAWILDNE